MDNSKSENQAIAFLKAGKSVETGVRMNGGFLLLMWLGC